MNRPDSFDTQKNDIQNTEQIQAPEELATQNGPQAEKTDEGAVRWYSVSYQGPGTGYATYSQTGQPPRSSKGKRVALIAAVVALCVLFSAMAGFGGAMLVGLFELEGLSDASTLPDEDAGNQFPGGSIGNQSGTTDTTNRPTYPYTDSSYDFAAALGEISKSSDESLIGSANGSAGSNKKSLIEVTSAVKDSVVEITTTTISNRGTISAGAGSGVIIHEDGIIVTNNHVIEDCDNIYVRLTNGDTYEARVRGTNEEGDIAIIKITPQQDKPLTVARLGYSKALALGEEVIAIGNPLGELGGTVTNGIISALEREVSIEGVNMTLLQTNAAINSGNSGGGLFNMAGELIGVVNAKYSASGVEGLGFAIPIDSAYEDSFKDLMNYGYIRGIPTLGVTLVDATGGSFMSPVYGAYVYSVGTQTGFQEGDYIYSIDGTVVYSITTSAVDAIRSIVRAHAVGDKLTVVVKRGSTSVTLTVTLQEYNPTVNLEIEE